MTNMAVMPLGVVGAKVGTRWVVSNEDMQKLNRILQDKSRREPGGWLTGLEPATLRTTI